METWQVLDGVLVEVFGVSESKWSWKVIGDVIWMEFEWIVGIDGSDRWQVAWREELLR